ncbi:hypothetical protein RYX36_019791 [Vicia faba]
MFKWIVANNFTLIGILDCKVMPIHHSFDDSSGNHNAYSKYKHMDLNILVECKELFYDYLIGSALELSGVSLGLDKLVNNDSSFFKIHAASAYFLISGSRSNVEHKPSRLDGGMSYSRNWFSYKELIKATNGFSTLNLLGEDGFGLVYKGCLPDGREIIVKQLKIDGSQGERIQS